MFNQKSKFLIKSPAKINWFLNIEESRDDGYHNLQTVMQLIDLYDNLSFEPLSERKIELIETGFKSGCLPKNNIIFSAAERLKKTFNVDFGVRITVNKSIPVGAGLGGGSANAAATLYVLNLMWGIDAQYEKLTTLATELGADVPFFLNAFFTKKTAAFCSGIGEKISSISSQKFHVVLWNPGIHLSTADVYNKFDEKKRKTKLEETFLKAYSSGDTNAIAENIWNNLAFAAEESLPELIEMKIKCLELKALKSWVSGSGPTVISLCENKEKAELLAAELRGFSDKNHFVHQCETIVNC